MQENPRRERRTYRRDDEATLPAGRRMPVYGQSEEAEPERVQADEQPVAAETPFAERHPVWTWLIAMLVILAVLAGAWFLSRDFKKQTPDMLAATETPAPTEVFVVKAAELPTVSPTDEPPPVIPTQMPTPEPTKAPTPDPTNPPTSEPTKAPTPDPTKAPTPDPTKAPTPEPTKAPTPDPTKKPDREEDEEEEISFAELLGELGWKSELDPWFIAKVQGLVKEVPEAFGMPILTKSLAEFSETWPMLAVADPWAMAWLRFQMELDVYDNMEEVNRFAYQLTMMPKAQYDAIVEETLTEAYRRIENSTPKVSKGWNLEVMMRDVKGRWLPELFARRNGDSNNVPDTLIAYYDKSGNNVFYSEKAFKVACKAAGVNSADYSPDPWINAQEGGTWKWREGERPVPTNPPQTNPPPTNPPPTNPPPTDPPPTNPPPTNPPPTNPPPTNPPPTDPPPTKDPGQRPTVSDAPVGGGETNPENSADPQTTTHVESTPAPPDPTSVPVPTAAPTPVPTAVVRPTEVCLTVAPTPIREDVQSPPAGDDNHNVADKETEGEADDSFDPDSI